jgi:hypothetical protein
MANPRVQFAAQHLENLAAVIQQPEVQRGLGPTLSAELTANFGRLVLPNTRNGIITIPDDDGDKIPFIALKPGDTFKLGPEFNSPSARQRDSYEKLYTEWEPSKASPEQAASQISHPGEPVVVQGPVPQMGASAITVSIVGNPDIVRKHYGLKHMPDAGLFKFMLRPLVVVTFGHTDSDIIMHELTHAEQKTVRPARLFSSQEDVNMDALGDELPAYDTGAIIRRLINPADNPAYDPFLQMRATAARVIHNKGLQDPFHASPSLLAYYASRGMGHILHGALDYEAQYRQAHAAGTP